MVRDPFHNISFCLTNVTYTNRTPVTLFKLVQVLSVLSYKTSTKNNRSTKSMCKLLLLLLFVALLTRTSTVSYGPRDKVLYETIQYLKMEPRTLQKKIQQNDDMINVLHINFQYECL